MKLTKYNNIVTKVWCRIATYDIMPLLQWSLYTLLQLRFFVQLLISVRPR